MGYLWIAFLVILPMALADDTCPTAAELAPCTCDGEGVNCMGAISISQIKKAFQSRFKYGGVRSIWIQGTQITSVPSDLFGSVKAQQFYIEVNNVTSVNLDAFKSSRTVLSSLSLFGNQLTSFPYSEISDYPNLRSLNIARNQLKSIPANSFNHNNLIALILAQNQISTIGMNAFSNLPSLQRLEISYNALTTLNAMSFAFRSHSSALQINLSGNRIYDVSSSAFTGAEPHVLLLTQNQLTSLPYASFGNLIVRIAQKGGYMEVSYNPFTCKGCDYSWLLLNKNALAGNIIGFRCPDGTGIQHLTKSGIGC